MKFITMWAVLMAGVLISLSSWADKVYLKNGDVIEGNVLNATEQVIVIKTATKVYKYEADNVERVERDNEEAFVNPETEALTDKKRELIKNLLNANGVRRLIEANVQKTLDHAPAGQSRQYAEIFNADVVVDLLIPIYANKFSTQDLERLVVFFESPTGKRFVAASPAILEDVFKTITAYFQNKTSQ